MKPAQAHSCLVLVLYMSGSRTQVSGGARRAHGVLMPSSIRQWQIVERETGAQSDQAVGQAEFDVLSAVDDLVERSAGCASLFGQPIAILDREG